MSLAQANPKSKAGQYYYGVAAVACSLARAMCRFIMGAYIQDLIVAILMYAYT